jgi:hypothetical protein
VLRKRQVDVGSSELEGFKELFQVFSLTKRHVSPDGNCMSFSEVENTMCQDMSGGNDRKEISKAQRETRTKEIRQGEKEWFTFMGQPTEYGDNILLQAIELYLKKPVQVFSYDSKDDTVYMQTMVCDILSKEETMEVSSDRHRPQVSDFQDDDTLRLAYQ